VVVLDTAADTGVDMDAAGIHAYQGIRNDTPVSSPAARLLRERNARIQTKGTPQGSHLLQIVVVAIELVLQSLGPDGAGAFANNLAKPFFSGGISSVLLEIVEELPRAEPAGNL
jgi:hypothetical protein